MIILCADDFGLSGGVSRGILELCRDGRLSATSVMVTFDRWGEDAARLKQVRETTAIGLHLNLTLGRPLALQSGTTHLDADGTLIPAKSLIRRALLRQLQREPLRVELRAQIAAFYSATGSLPDFLDGHQHVHVLPTVRTALLEAISDFAWPHPPLVRVPANLPAWLLGGDEKAKRAVVATLASGFRHRLQKAGLPTNDTFAGFSSFKRGADYIQELQRALVGGGRCHLVMCHPGYIDDELISRGDPLVERRAEELNGLLTMDRLSQRIWHPVREDGGSIDWTKAIGA